MLVPTWLLLWQVKNEKKQRERSTLRGNMQTHVSKCKNDASMKSKQSFSENAESGNAESSTYQVQDTTSPAVYPQRRVYAGCGIPTPRAVTRSQKILNSPRVKSSVLLTDAMSPSNGTPVMQQSGLQQLHSKEGVPPSSARFSSPAASNKIPPPSQESIHVAVHMDDEMRYVTPKKIHSYDCVTKSKTHSDRKKALVDSISGDSCTVPIESSPLASPIEASSHVEQSPLARPIKSSSSDNLIATSTSRARVLSMDGERSAVKPGFPGFSNGGQAMTRARAIIDVTRTANVFQSEGTTAIPRESRILSRALTPRVSAAL